MIEDNIKKRKWVKKMGVLFFILMLLLTFFSNTIMNVSLPVVSMQSVKEGNIKNTVTGTGKAEAVSTYDIMINQTRTIKEVLVGVGDTVSEGQALFEVEEEDSEELKDEEDNLYNLNIEYQKMLLDMGQADYTMEDRNIKRTTDALTEAIEKSNQNHVTKENVLNKKQEVAEIKADIDEINKDIEDLQKDLQKYSNGSDSSLKQLERSIDDKKIELNKAETASEKNESLITQLKRDLSRLEDDYDDMQDDSSKSRKLNDKIEDRKDDLDKKKKELELEEEAYQELNSKYQIWQETQKEIKTLEQNLEDRLYELEKKKQDDNKDIQNKNLDLQKTKKDIQNQREKIYKINSEVKNGKIISKKAGKVKSISITAGASTSPNTAIAVIETNSRGYYLSFPVSKKQSEMVNIGDLAKVDESKQVKATLYQIKNDSSGMEDGKVLTFILEGEVESEKNYTVNISKESKKYKLIVPKSSLHSDNTGSFVLSITSKRTPFGSRYVVKRIDVKVLAEDDQNAAVLGQLIEGDYIVSISDKLIKSGDNVRLANE